MGDEPNRPVPISPIRKDDPSKIDAGAQEGGKAAPAPEGQKPFPNPAKIIDGKPQLPPTPRRHPEPTD